MSVSAGPMLDETGLVFYYDVGNTVKSWKGKPTSNHAYFQNPRVDSSYASYSATASGTWNAKHPDAIRVYNDLGSEITGYVNTGVTDWTNTYHAIWTYEQDLQRPVVTMRDVDGQWKAKSFALQGNSFPSDMGLTAGSTYTISWLSWTSDITKCANAGMYSKRLSDATYNFWDGQSNSQGTAFNTKVGTWQRVYATFTLNAVIDTASWWACYMYGHYGNRGTVKIADVQIETGVGSTFSKSFTRSNTESIIDLTSNRVATISDASYNSDGTISFLNNNGFTIPSIDFPSEQTIEIWLKPEENDANRRNPYNQAYGGYGTLTHEPDGSINYYYGDGAGNAQPYIGHTSSFTVLQNETACICVTRDTTQSIWYKNGVEYNSYAHSFGTLTTHSTPITIGSGYAGGYYGRIYAVKLYTRKLSAAEVKANFNALRGRYGI